MGKRSSFKRRAKDYYPTPIEALQPLAPHLLGVRSFAEPCAGNGVLIDHMRMATGLACSWASDVLPRRGDVVWRDALDVTAYDLRHCDVIVTNPPWSRPILHRMIEHFRSLKTTWLLFDADWPHTRQSAPFMPYCHEIVPVGRVKWIPGSKHTGKDNCAWYRFEDREGSAVFHARAA